jgi:hypothetical protein
MNICLYDNIGWYYFEVQTPFSLFFFIKKLATKFTCNKYQKNDKLHIWVHISLDLNYLLFYVSIYLSCFSFNGW